MYSLDKSEVNRERRYSLIDLCVIVYLFTIGVNTDIINNTAKNIIAFVVIALLLFYEFRKRTIEFDWLWSGLIVFCVYCFLSIIWAADANAAIERSITVFKLVVISLLMYDYYKTEAKERTFINMYIAFGVIYALFILAYYGLGNYVTQVFSGLRVGNAVQNDNTIGIITIITALFCLQEGITSKKWYYWIAMLLCIFVALGTGSRKVVVSFIVGFTIYFLIRLINQRKMKGFFVLLVAFGVVIMLLESDLFSGTMDRFQLMLNGIRGTGESDYSTYHRTVMIDLGWEQFKKTPIFGLGIGNSNVILGNSILGSQYGDSYLHNNYVELLSTAGIVGTLMYYVIYLTPLKILFKNIRRIDEQGIAVLSMMIVLLVSHYGQVCYFSKDAYIYIVIFALYINRLRNKIILNNLE